MSIYRTVGKAIAAFLIVAVVSGCATSHRRSSELSDQNNETVALDFVNALSGLRGHNPTNTMLQIRPPSTDFGESLRRELRNAGYGIQSIAKNDEGPMLVTYQADSFENSTYKSVAYRLRVGGVEMGREYEVRAGRIFPVTSLSVKGVEIASRPLDQSMFERSNDVMVPDDSGEWIPIQPSTENKQPRSIPHDDTIVRVMPAPVPEIEILAGSRQQGGYSIENEPLQRPKTNQNMLMLGESNYKNIFDEYSVLKENIIVFPNDSLHLGRAGKLKVLSILDDFNSDSDLISVIGCSHGKSKIADGNKRLALGRARRVMDELLYNNVPADRLYDEGCWAGVEQKTLPSRGVIVTLRRQNK